MRKLKNVIAAIGLLATIVVNAQSVDYSVVSVPQESNGQLVCITSDNDYVCMPLVERGFSTINWLTTPVLAISPSGNELAFLSYRNETSNIFIRDLNVKKAASQRTKRSTITSFAYSPDGQKICFSEQIGEKDQIFQTSAKQGFVCRQITDGNNDYGPVYSRNGQQIYFARQEENSISIWGYDSKSNMLSSYTNGMNPYAVDANHIYCTRLDAIGKGEIWRINITDGVEECIVTDADKTFSTPSLSPDGQWVLFVGSNGLPFGSKMFYNTDIFVARTDGSELRQLTFHAADDLSPVWSRDGKYIYFVSQRGSATGTANIWRMTFAQ